jgi:hypothetical protein
LQWTCAAVLFAGLLVPHAAAAQFATGQKFLGAHIGLSGVGSTAAIGVNGEVAYNKNISIGAWADTWSYGDNYSFQGGSAEWNVRYIAVAGTGAYHFPIESQPKLDPFVGAAVGYYVVNTSQKGTFIGDYSGSANRLFVGGYGGARYFFKPNLAGVARVGFGASYLTLGVDFKL